MRWSYGGGTRTFDFEYTLQQGPVLWTLILRGFGRDEHFQLKLSKEDRSQEKQTRLDYNEQLGRQVRLAVCLIALSKYKELGRQLSDSDKEVLAKGLETLGTKGVEALGT